MSNTYGWISTRRYTFTLGQCWNINIFNLFRRVNTFGIRDTYLDDLTFSLVRTRLGLVRFQFPIIVVCLRQHKAFVSPSASLQPSQLFYATRVNTHQHSYKVCISIFIFVFVLCDELVLSLLMSLSFVFKINNTKTWN